MIEFSKLIKNNELGNEEKGCLKFKRQFNGGYLRDIATIIFPSVKKTRSKAETLNLIKKIGLGEDENHCKKILRELTKNTYPIYSSFSESELSLIKNEKNNYLVKISPIWYIRPLI
ncbi:hypothetical protein KAJ87_04505 [Candidatus Pacearchaeota archaeon]|nr:hypothetical protein [Candidatus Pacearchaeota archaeon]